MLHRRLRLRRVHAGPGGTHVTGWQVWTVLVELAALYLLYAISVELEEVVSDIRKRREERK